MVKPEKLLGDLIALPSVNPAFLPANHSQAGEQRVAEFLAGIATAAGLDVQLQRVLPRRSNLLARLTPSGKISQRVLLAPHLDTVPVFEPSQLQPQRKGGRLHGRGACDTKGSVAAMLAAVCELAAGKRRPQHTEIVFAGLVDEENAQAGSRALGASGFQADLAIVGEPTDCEVITAHKGSLWLRLETKGKSAHGAKPELGRNAVHAMARIVDALESDYAAQLQRRRHPLLGHGTVNVGVIRGGTQPNIVPDACSITIDRRTLPGETEAGVRREITALLKRKKLSARFTSEKAAPTSALETDPRLPLVRQFMAQAGQKRAAGVDYFCDAAVLAGHGIPSVVFGPGNIAQAHTMDEWISLKSLNQAKDILLSFLGSLP